MGSFKEKPEKFSGMVRGTLEKIPYEKIAEFPVVHRLLAMLLILLILPLIYFFTLYGNQQKEVANLNNQISAQKLDIVRLKKTSKNLAGLENDVTEMNRRLKVVRARLPDGKEIASLLTEISRIGTHGGLHFLTFKPLNETYETYYAKVPVNMVIRGSYHDLLTFFDQISRMPRIVTISNINLSMAKARGGINLVEAKCLATTFRYLTEEERNRRAEAEKAKKKRRR